MLHTAGKSLSPTQKRGRPSKPYKQSCDQSKRRIIQSKYRQISSSELLDAARSSLYIEGNQNQASLVAAASTLEETQHIHNCIKQAEKFQQIPPFSPEEALVMVLDCGMSKNVYQSQRKVLNRRLGMELYPSYEKVVEVKRQCYPADIEVKPEG